MSYLRLVPMRLGRIYGKWMQEIEYGRNIRHSCMKLEKSDLLKLF
jgi:hypothetical protein